MILKRLLLISLLVFTTQVEAFQLKKSLLKKVKKELVKTFDDKSLVLESIPVSKEVNAKLHKTIAKDHLNKIIKGAQVIGYTYIAKAPSKTDEFDFLIILDENLIIKKAKILIYREDYGGEIGSKRWLKQFTGKTSGIQLKYTKDIIAISGATISALSMTVAVNTFLKDVAILNENQVL
jgi:hypothetical protein